MQQNKHKGQVYTGLPVDYKVGGLFGRELGGMGELCTSLRRIKVEYVFQALGGWLFLFLHSISELPPNHIMSHY